ncbi:MAG: D-phenylhydantoinase [Chloroflexi bacterium ADurb.Bin325]|nr:MAG: D-phenylhydantoinase [Chloroflexi bacterium ADurb.Bin325]
MQTTTLIRNGTLILPDGERQGDILLAGERVAAVGPALAAEGADAAIDAAGCVVLPGLVDPHTHIQLDTGLYRTPDDWEVGTRTAACGGVTTVIDFATQFPGQDVRAALAARQAEIGARAQIDYGLHMMLTELPEEDAALDRWLADLLAAGVNSIKVYTTYRPNYYQDDAALLRALAAAARRDLVVMIHCENDALVAAATRSLVAAGRTGLAYHGRARPALAEVEAAHRALFLARAAGGPRLYIVHCSVGDTVAEVTQAAAQGQRALAETTVQYLTLDEAVYRGEHPEWGVMQPPLRAAGEPARLWARLMAGEIATIGTDHCDYTLAQKRERPEFTRIPGGIPGLETLLPLLATHGVAAGRLTWPRLAALTSANPARIFGLAAKGRLAAGLDADVVIYDPRPETTLRAERLHNLAGYTPYEGWRVQGAVRDVFVRGRRLVREGEFVGAAGWGRFVRAQTADPVI